MFPGGASCVGVAVVQAHSGSYARFVRRRRWQSDRATVTPIITKTTAAAPMGTMANAQSAEAR